MRTLPIIKGFTIMNEQAINLGKMKQILKQSGIFYALLLLIISASLISPYFLQTANLINILRQISIIGIVSVGLTFVILTKGIDLSVGSIIGTVAVVSASMLHSGVSIPLVLFVGLLIGALIGAVNGIGIAFGKIQPFIMTLGIMVAARGLAQTYAKGQPISLGETTSSFYWLGGGNWFGIPVPVYLFIFVALIAIFVLKFTSFGRYVYAIGDNLEASRLSGVNTKKITFIVYIISGFLSALTALILVSRLTVGEPTAGTGFELDAIAIVVIGGTSLFGGEGGVKGTIIGAAIIAVLANVLNLLGVTPFTQQIVKGLIIIIAVLLEQRKRL